ncbi:type II secretion system protein [Mitsuaria sp. WAJ17]|uniref:type IV pilus modification PilV family protein n=1 Tax=Mitsuaria sp. WAJ17 TaxID=2761452 RepID=UPI001602CA3A|nr:type II secretion system protein [Mitsuaria sp. WAJ17]MBB2486423.1 type II secretion system protein [Mitsuaria sp. WAJ17]
MPNRPAFTATLRPQAGLTLVELLVFIMVLGLALAGVLQVFAMATRASANPQAQRQALAIAESLLQEVQLQPFTFCDPDDAAATTAASAAGCATTAEALGPEAGETRYTAPQFDNVNDYHGFSMSGIVDITNSPVAGLSGYSASVQIAPAALMTVPAGDALRITVQVSGPGNTSVTLQGYRTRQAPNAG